MRVELSWPCLNGCLFRPEGLKVQARYEDCADAGVSERRNVPDGTRRRKAHSGDRVWSDRAGERWHGVAVDSHSGQS